MKSGGLRGMAKRLVIRKGIGPFRQYVDAISANLEYGDWLKRNDCGRAFSTRYEIYDYVNAEVLKNEPIDYLEFGVYRGDSIRYWSGLNRCPGSRFFGFDSFEGLPSDWQGFFETVPKGSFDTGGEAPKIDDPRVAFVKGYFQETLSRFLEGFEPRNRLVIHCDADVYSSTLFVLCKADDRIKPGTVVIFDEFSGIHEFNALVDYAESFLRKYRVIGHCGDLCHQLAVEML